MTGSVGPRRAGPGLVEMWRILRLALAHRREPLPFGRAVSELVLRYLRNRGVPIGGRLLDVGTGSGTLPEALSSAGGIPVALDIADRRVAGVGRTAFSIGRGERLPFRSSSFELVLSSNVLEHVGDPWRVIDELMRVCRPGGFVYLSWTNWYSPFGGHDWSPLHYLGPRLGPRLFEAIRGRPPLIVPGRNLFPLHVGQVIRGLEARETTIVDVAPRYWPSLKFLGRVPILREFAMWNCVILLRRGNHRRRAPS